MKRKSGERRAHPAAEEEKRREGEKRGSEAKSQWVNERGETEEKEKTAAASSAQAKSG